MPTALRLNHFTGHSRARCCLLYGTMTLSFRCGMAEQLPALAMAPLSVVKSVGALPSAHYSLRMGSKMAVTVDAVRSSLQIWRYNLSSRLASRGPTDLRRW